MHKSIMSPTLSSKRTTSKAVSRKIFANTFDYPPKQEVNDLTTLIQVLPCSHCRNFSSSSHGNVAKPFRNSFHEKSRFSFVCSQMSTPRNNVPLPSLSPVFSGFVCKDTRSYSDIYGGSTCKINGKIEDKQKLKLTGIKKEVLSERTSPRNKPSLLKKVAPIKTCNLSAKDFGTNCPVKTRRIFITPIEKPCTKPLLTLRSNIKGNISHKNFEEYRSIVLKFLLSPRNACSDSSTFLKKTHKVNIKIPQISQTTDSTYETFS